VTAALVDAYDAALFDLDGVVYLGPVAVEGAPAGLAELRRRGVALGYVTNNAARSPEVVAEHLVSLGIEAQPGDVVTSAEAAARLLRNRCGPGARVLASAGRASLAALAEQRADRRPLGRRRPRRGHPGASASSWPGRS
jgi:ribonucleotide monophosphatase NagD (HAD superfamily)